ncbi:BTAD domain-containing putative transcriptional regulator [Egicoccus sp. AB-alg6-2]|uniref:AfsR/SARP family transcriptional regulator n=1 Tax=Egicoccus sp. AB-alg6-2 TaxID=3242692 RepID=UPI00359E742D
MKLASPSVRFHLTARVTVEGRRRLDEADLPGRQGRLALVYLVANRHRPVSVDELAAALWGDDLPPSWQASLRALVSKLRANLEYAGAGRLTRSGGCYQALLGSAWVDLEESANAVDRAEGARRRGDLAAAWGDATVGASITRRPLLAGEDLPWIATLRDVLEHRAVRALDILAEVNLACGDHHLAAEAARSLIDLAPFRETGYRHLIRAEAARGDLAEAVRVFHRLRVLLDEELGARPSVDTQRALTEVLASTSAPPVGGTRGAAMGPAPRGGAAVPG